MPAARFSLSWVLLGELALGPAPQAERHLDRLETEGIAGILSLCSEQEAAAPNGMAERFCCHRLVLPDHRAGRALQLLELEQAIAMLGELSKQGPVFVHCVAAMERSPLLCLAWLMVRHGLSQQRSLDYLMQVHPGTNPLPVQLALLSKWAGGQARAQ